MILMYQYEDGGAILPQFCRLVLMNAGRFSVWPIAALTVALAFFLLFLKFDLETSPAWQVGVHYLMLFSLLSIMFVSASIRGLGSGGIFRRVMLALAFLTPVAVFFIGWALFGVYSGLRDPRLFQMAVVSVSTFLFLWMVIALPYSWYLLARVFFRSGT